MIHVVARLQPAAAPRMQHNRVDNQSVDCQNVMLNMKIFHFYLSYIIGNEIFLCFGLLIKQKSNIKAKQSLIQLFNFEDLLFFL